VNEGFLGFPQVQLPGAETLYRRIQVGIDTPPAVASIPNVSVPTSGRHLRVVWTSRTDSASHDTYLLAQLNGDAGANYSSAEVFMLASVSGTQATSLTGIRLGRHSGTADLASLPGSGNSFFPFYSVAGFNKVMFSQSIYSNTATTFAGLQFIGYWNNTVAVTSVTFAPATGNFVVGSIFDIYVDR
jgi:hypothetical protein